MEAPQRESVIWGISRAVWDAERSPRCCVKRPCLPVLESWEAERSSPDRMNNSKNQRVRAGVSFSKRFLAKNLRSCFFFFLCDEMENVSCAARDTVGYSSASDHADGDPEETWRRLIGPSIDRSKSTLIIHRSVCLGKSQRHCWKRGVLKCSCLSLMAACPIEPDQGEL